MGGTPTSSVRTVQHQLLRLPQHGRRQTGTDSPHIELIINFFYSFLNAACWRTDFLQSLRATPKSKLSYISDDTYDLAKILNSSPLGDSWPIISVRHMVCHVLAKRDLALNSLLRRLSGTWGRYSLSNMEAQLAGNGPTLKVAYTWFHMSLSLRRTREVGSASLRMGLGLSTIRASWHTSNILFRKELFLPGDNKT